MMTRERKERSRAGAESSPVLPSRSVLGEIKKFCPRRVL